MRVCVLDVRCSSEAEAAAGLRRAAGAFGSTEEEVKAITSRAGAKDPLGRQRPGSGAATALAVPFGDRGKMRASGLRSGGGGENGAPLVDEEGYIVRPATVGPPSNPWRRDSDSVDSDSDTGMRVTVTAASLVLISFAYLKIQIGTFGAV